MDPRSVTLKSHGQCDEGMGIQHPVFFEHSFLTAGYDEVAFRLDRQVRLEGRRMRRAASFPLSHLNPIWSI
jgi:hypothetical protein